MNQKEVEELAGGASLREAIFFPGGTQMTYVLEPFGHTAPTASFVEGTIRISAPGNDIKDWAGSQAVGLYFHIPADGTTLKVAIEKDLECLDGPVEERDPYAFERSDKSAC